MRILAGVLVLSVLVAAVLVVVSGVRNGAGSHADDNDDPSSS